ncbi:MAG: POTRA domain-containing protein, partial [Acidobacteriaceae bacterium]
MLSYVGQNVTAIEIAGQPNLSTRQFNSDFVQQAGEPFSAEKMNATIANLKRDSRFKTIQLQALPEANGVRILLVLEPAFYFGIYEFPGAERFSYSRLVQVTNYPPEAPYNADEVQQAQKKLIVFFHQEGYFLATVQPSIHVDPSHHIANVMFNVVLNRRTKFGQIDISGTNPQEKRTLAHDLQTLWARIRGAAIRPGKNYRRKTLTNAVQYLQTRLAKQGYLDAQVKLAGAEYVAATNRTDIHFNVNTGPIVSVKINGAHLWSWTRKSLLPIYQGIGVDQEVVQEGNRYLASYFQAKGYFNVKVESTFQKDSLRDVVTYTVTKGKKHRVEAVRLTANHPGITKGLLPYVAVKKEHLFSRGKYL